METETHTEGNRETQKYASQDPDLVPVSRFLGFSHIGDISGSDEGKIQRILEWARTGGTDKVDVLWTLQEAERHLDPPPIGVSRLERLYQWAVLELEEAKIRKEKAVLQKK